MTANRRPLVVITGTTQEIPSGDTMDPATLLADQAAGTASLRTLGTGSTQAAAGNHTHAAAKSYASRVFARAMFT